MPDYDLMSKTELTIRPIALRDADLARVAEAVAETLGLARGDVLVTDVLGDQVVVDVLRRGVDAHALLGRKGELRARLDAIPGVQCSDETDFSSRGMLSWIALDAAEGGEILRRSEELAQGIRQMRRRSALVFSTGAEVVGGQVKDTNAPLVRDRLAGAGWEVRLAGALPDDELLLAERLRQAADEGYGLLVTTGGVGAEDKDRTIEAVLRADPGAATPHIVRYELGVGRHRHKAEVRIAVGRIGETLVVSLPGPNDEVQVGLSALLRGLAAGEGPPRLAEGIAADLRERLREKRGAGPGPTQHE